MAHFLYVTEVFCPWCYGFSPVISNIKEYYALPFRVLCGSLIDIPTTLLQRLERTPNVEAFIDRMYAITKVRISDDYVKMLRSSKNTEIFMDSQKGGLLFYALKHFREEQAFAIMKDLQEFLYGKGCDVLSKEVLHKMCEKYTLDFEILTRFMDLEETKVKAYEETEYTFEIMEDVVLYPTLYYVDQNLEGAERRYFISRGFIEYDTCISRINAVMDACKQGLSPEEFETQKEVLLQAEHNKQNNKQNNLNEQAKNIDEKFHTQAPFSCALDGKCE